MKTQTYGKEGIRRGLQNQVGLCEKWKVLLNSYVIQAHASVPWNEEV